MNGIWALRREMLYELGKRRRWGKRRDCMVKLKSKAECVFEFWEITNFTIGDDKP